MQEPLDQDAPAPVAPAPAPATGTGLARAAAVLFGPRAAFTAIAARPTWLVPLLLIVALSAISTALWVPRIDVEELVRTRVGSSAQGMDPGQLDQVAGMMSRLRWVMFLGPVLVFQPLLLALTAAAFHLVFRVLGSERRFVHSMAVVTHAFLPLAVAALLSIPLLLGTESISAEEITSGGVLVSNLGFLAPEDASPAIQALLQSLDFFSLWTVVLLVIGYARSTGLAYQTVASCVVALWGVWILARVGLAVAGA